MSLEEFEKTSEKQRFRLALSAPAHGLYLNHVRYDYIPERQDLN